MLKFKNDRKQYAHLNIFQEAAESKKDDFGYRARRYAHLLLSKEYSWNCIRIEYGIRWSDCWQIFPIWNTSHNQLRSLTFGTWLLYVEVGYYRKHWCYHNDYFKKLPFQNIHFMSKLYRLLL